MSTLDKAFIRAYTKDTDSQTARPNGTPTEGEAAESAQVVQPGTFQSAADLYTGSTHRAHQSHVEDGAEASTPHVQFSQPVQYTEFAYVSPYHQTSAPEAPVEADRQPPTPVPPADSPPNQLAETDDPITDEAKQALASAATLKIPQPLQLPSVFEALAGDEQAEEAAKEFSPDWEVDRFVWPEICERLLKVESRYFEHVGQRLQAATEQGRHVLMIAGSRRGEGRTSLALCLARCAAESGVNVAIVDADIRNPQLGTRLGMETPCSWLEVVAGKAPLDEAAVASVEDRLTLFPLAGSEDIQIESGDKRLLALVQEISSHYPLVIVDTGPLAAEECHSFADTNRCPVDAAIVVRDLRYTTEKKAAATAEQLQQSGIQAVGIAENFKST